MRGQFVLKLTAVGKNADQGQAEADDDHAGACGPAPHAGGTCALWCEV